MTRVAMTGKEFPARWSCRLLPTLATWAGDSAFTAPLPFAPSRLFIWGTSWGMQGYFTIRYAYLTDSNLCDDLWMIQMVA